MAAEAAEAEGSARDGGKLANKNKVDEKHVTRFLALRHLTHSASPIFFHVAFACASTGSMMVTDSIPVGVDIDTVETQALEFDTKDSSVGGPKELASTEPSKKTRPPVPAFDETPETPEPPVPQLLIPYFPDASMFSIFVHDNSYLLSATLNFIGLT